MLLLSFLAFSQATDNDKLWNQFMDWAKAQPGAELKLEKYRAKLIETGLTPAEAGARIALIPKLYNENPAYRTQADATGFNKLYRAPEQTRFTTDPNAFLVSTIKGLKPGKALDVAMGQGRNAVYLATQGWDVTGFDIAEEGLNVASQNAARAGARITTAQSRFDDFDYGRERWDLIYFVYTDAPIVEPKYVARIRDALKPGGLVLIDRPFRSLTNPEPGWPDTEQDKPNALAKAWSDLQIVFYEDTTGFGDWQQTSAGRLEYKLRIVRLLARKR
ncbi:MAG TPA: methyltransferase domain-containing protein [Bryobacteraceae bacterium]|nr:methyltransferase domain-containing protein [Bryobacteraceae bacterium]